MLKSAHGKFQEVILRTCSKVQGEIIISLDQGAQFPPTVSVKGRRGPLARQLLPPSAGGYTQLALNPRHKVNMTPKRNETWLPSVFVLLAF